MSNFNFTSQVCTSRSQSERLLALGLKKETADMMYCKTAYGESISVKDDDYLEHLDSPAWSLHRLIEIAQLPQYWQCVSGDWYNEVIAHIQSMIYINEFNKDYLEK
jgi:hypothetical protein